MGTVPFVTPSVLIKASVHDVDHDFLVFLGHFVVAGQAQSSGKNIRAYINAAALYVRIGPAAAVAFCCDEGRGSVDRLHVHGLPDGSALGAE